MLAARNFLQHFPVMINVIITTKIFHIDKVIFKFVVKYMDITKIQ